jgi:hypothetical protein
VPVGVRHSSAKLSCLQRNRVYRRRALTLTVLARSGIAPIIADVNHLLFSISRECSLNKTRMRRSCEGSEVHVW